LRETELAASALWLTIQILDVLGPKDVDIAFRAARKEGADAVLVLAGSVSNFYQKKIADLAIRRRLPAIYINPEYVESGGLVSYGASINDLYRRATAYVDKILKGAKPADLPVEQPTKTAKQIGLTIPPNVLTRADRVIR
jgi:putative ABC transport system substrate-binding protein